MRAWGVAIAATLALGAADARAATTIGQTFAPASTCGPAWTTLQSTSPGSAYAAATTGVITSWSYFACAVAGQIKFKVFRRFNATTFLVVGESAPATMTANTLNTRTVRIPVQAGDLIGFQSGADQGCWRSAAGFGAHHVTGDPRWVRP